MKKSYIIWIALGAILLFVWSQFNSMSKLSKPLTPKVSITKLSKLCAKVKTVETD